MISLFKQKRTLMSFFCGGNLYCRFLWTFLIKNGGEKCMKILSNLILVWEKEREFVLPFFLSRNHLVNIAICVNERAKKSTGHCDFYLSLKEIVDNLKNLRTALITPFYKRVVHNL